MKSFKEYLTESKKTYSFRVKVAADCSTEQEDHMKSILERFSIAEFKKVGKTPIQELPLDFPQVKNCEVCIYEVTLEYPTTSFELTEYISQGIGISKQRLAVRAPNEPTEQYQSQQQEKREAALLSDSEYKEASNASFKDYYGTEYNAKFLKELNDTVKEQQKARGEQRPAGEQPEMSTESAGSQSPIQQAKDPRKK